MEGLHELKYRWLLAPTALLSDVDSGLILPRTQGESLMNWEAIGGTGELLGALGVIASLLYLARQVRSGRVDARRVAAQAVFAKMNTAFETMAANPQLADVFVRGTTSLSALSPAEAIQFSSTLFTLTRPYEEILHYKRAGAVEDWVWESVELVVLPCLATPGGLEWWAKRRSWFTAAFQSHVSSILPAEAVEMLTGFEQAAEGKDFRGGVLTQTPSAERSSEAVG